MTEEMHNGMQILIDIERPTNFNKWLKDIDVFDPDENTPWMLVSKKYIVTATDGDIEVIDKRKLH